MKWHSKTRAGEVIGSGDVPLPRLNGGESDVTYEDDGDAPWYHYHGNDTESPPSMAGSLEGFGLGWDMRRSRSPSPSSPSSPSSESSRSRKRKFCQIL
jgi:hypothetical protein